MKTPSPTGNGRASLSFHTTALISSLTCLSLAGVTHAGTIRRLIYEGLPGDRVADLTSAPTYPDAPSRVELVEGFLQGQSDIGDEYGSLMEAWLEPPQSGDYTFWLHSDDLAELWLSTDATSTGLRRVARVGYWTFPDEWDKSRSQKSDSIPLVRGERYFLRVIQKEYWGGDNIGVGWQRPDGTLERPMPTRYAQAHLAKASTLGIARQPASATTKENQPVTFSLDLDPLNRAVSFQWYLNSEPIPGAVLSWVTFKPPLADDGKDVWVKIDDSLESARATLIVTPDVERPQVLQVDPLGYDRLVEIRFSEPMAVGEATNPENYALDGGAVAILSAELLPGGEVVRVRTEPFGWESTHRLSVVNLTDTAASPNLLQGDSFEFLASGVPPAALTIPVEPSDAAVVAHHDVSFAVQVAGHPAPTSIQWLRHNETRPPSPEACNGLLLEVPRLTTLDDGTGFQAVISNLVDVVVTRVARLTVLPDNEPPLLVSAAGSKSMEEVLLSFSERLDSLSAAAPALYGITGLTVQSATLQPNLTQVTLGTTRQEPGFVYHVSVDGVRDLTGNAMVSGEADFTSWLFSPGLASIDWYFVNWHWTVDEFLDEFLAYAEGHPPTEITVVPAMETPSWNRGEFYGARMEGILIPPLSGDYVFHICSDDYSQFRLSSDSSPKNLPDQPQCRVEGWTNQHEWDKYPDQTSGPIHLTANHHYYFGVHQIEWDGGDGFSVAWDRPDGTFEVIPREHLGRYTEPASAPVLTAPPEGRTVSLGSNAQFTVGVLGTPPLIFQWLKEGNPLSEGGRVSGVDTATLTISGVEADDAGTYSVTVANAFGVIISDPVQLAVRTQTIYEQGFDSLTAGRTGNPPRAGQDLWYAALAVGEGFGEIRAHVGNPSQALHEFAPASTPAGWQTIDARDLEPVDISSLPSVSLSADFRASSSDLSTRNGYMARLEIRGGPHPWYTINGFTLEGGGGRSKAETGLAVTIYGFNGADNNFPLQPEVGQGLAWDTWHQILIEVSPATGYYLGITVDGAYEDLSRFMLPRNELDGVWRQGGLIERIEALVVPNDWGSERSDDHIYWDNIRVWSGEPENLPPQITTQPQDHTKALGSTVRFSTEVSGTPPLVLQWLKDGNPLIEGGRISGVDTATLTISSIEAGDAGTYSATVANAFGSIITAPARLTIRNQVNLVVNGGFETPVVSVYEIFESLPGWTTTFGPGIEVQHDIAAVGSPYEGEQLVELASNANSGMVQQVPTIPGAWYRLEFAYSPRPGLYSDANSIAVFFDQVLVASITENGVGLENTRWSQQAFDVNASGTMTPLEFRATGMGADPSRGGLLDDVWLTVTSFPPQIQLCALRVLGEGSEGRIAARVDGLPLPQVQWYFQDAPIAGATDANLVLPEVTRAMEGTYRLTAINELGQATSAPIVAVVSNVDPERFPALGWTGDPTGGLTLEFAERLGPSAVWQALIDYPPEQTQQGFVEIQTTAPARFYRLSGPASPLVFTAAGFMTGWRYDDAVGTQHRIEYVDEAGGWLNWRTLAILTLPERPYLFIDEESLGSPARIYRTTPVR